MASNFSAHAAPGLISHPSDHGGQAETSAVMYLRPELVRRDKLADNPWGELAVPSLASPDVYFVRPWHLHVPNAAGGEQRSSTAEIGEKLITASAERLAHLLVDLSKTPMDDRFPFR